MKDYKLIKIEHMHAHFFYKKIRSGWNDNNDT